MHNGCILKGGVGSGKTRTAFAYVMLKEMHAPLQINGKGETGYPQAPKDLYVITTAKKRDSLDWEQEALPFMLSTNKELSIGGIKLTVDSWNNITDYEGVKDAVFIFDEQRLVGSGSWVKAFLKIARSNRWIMLSATPGDNWMDYIPVLVANGFYKNRTEFIRRHVVYSRFTDFPKVDHYVETRHLQNLRLRVVVDMEFARHTIRHIQTLSCTHPEETFNRVWLDRFNVYEDRPCRDIAELYRVARQVVSSSPDRIGAVLERLDHHKRLIVFYNFNYELEALRTLGATLSIPVAEWNGHRHDELPEGEHWLYLVQYTAGAEGWNCTTTDAIVFFSLTYSFKIFEQAMGRIDRINTPYIHLYYYVLRSNTPVDTAIWKALVAKKNFSEGSLVKWDVAA